ncbi:hypothetical protein BC831DRAFT_515249 [Entophlyctis helioformis]|nr:hypothetical protein BC831DRAFT_515249 [Entophlyctis helioformis]
MIPIAAVLALLAVSSTTTTTTMAQTTATTLSADYPPMDKRATPNALWSAQFVSEAARAANPALALPVSPVPLTGTDWTKDIRECTGVNDWSLTFDDGPSPYTPTLLNELRTRSIKATFFVVGSRVIQFPDTLKRINAEGHEIAIHTWSHAHLATLTNEEIVAEILFTARAIKEVVGVTPRFVRPPFGETDDRVRAVITALGFQSIMWNRDTLDGSGNTQVAALARGWVQAMSNGTTPRVGVISLEHDLYEAAVAQAPSVMTIVAADARVFKTVAECTGLAAYDETVWAGGTNGGSSNSRTAPVSVPSPPAGVKNAAMQIGGFAFEIVAAVLTVASTAVMSLF